MIVIIVMNNNYDVNNRTKQTLMIAYIMNPGKHS